MNTFLNTIAIALLFCLSANAQIFDSTENDTLVIPHADFVSRITRGATVYLPAGLIVQLDEEVYLPSGVTITTDENNPATIKKNPNVASGLSIQGEGITVENVVMDFDMQFVWGEYKSCIAFKIPAHTELVPDAPIRDILIRNVTFINPTGPEERDLLNDSWAIDFAHNSPESLKNIKVLNCRQLAPLIQLTGNGQGVEGVDGLEICHNFIEFGMTNSISYSSSTHNNAIKNVLISNNVLRFCQNVGIFVGQDGSDVDYNISLDNVVIADNYIEMDRESGEFPHCIAVRATAGCSGLHLARNVCNALYASGNVRWATLQGSVDSKGTYSLQDNVLLGPSSLIVNNLTEVPVLSNVEINN